MINYKIEPIKLDDLQSFHDALDSVAREKNFLAFLQAPSLIETKKFIHNNIVNHWPHLVAKINKKIIGWCDISPLDRPVFEHIGCLGMGVIKEFRNHGIGSQLLGETLKLAQKKGLTRIELTVREKNVNAISLYKKFGFIEEGFHKKAVLIDAKYENHISMALLF